MQYWLDQLTDLAAIRGEESILKEAFADFTEQAGFSGYAYLHIQPGHSLAVTNYHPEWQSLYFQRKYIAIDPVVNHAKTTKRAFVWSGEEDRSRLTKVQRSFYAHAADFGIRSGVTIPVRTANGAISLFTLASAKTTINLEREIDAVAAAGAIGQIHTRISILQVKPSAQNPSWLSPKEAAYLKWIAVGKTMEEVAELEGVKYNTVRVRIAELKKRLNVHTMTHLVALAIRAKLI